MKPKFDHLVKRTFVYRTAKETLEPGYLQERFRSLLKEQQKAAKAEAERALQSAAKVSQMKRRGAA